MIQWNKFLALVLAITVIAAAAAVAIPLIIRDINLGLDLQGGVYVLLEAQVPEEGETGEETPEEEPEKPSLWQRFTRRIDSLFGSFGGGELDQGINDTIEVLRNRVDQFGFTEPIIQREGERRIRIELATDPGATETDQRAIMEMIGRTAQLEFKDSFGETALTGANLRTARADFRPDEQGRTVPVVILEFDREGTRIFGDLTSSHIGQQVPIMLDGEVISSPMVNTAITDGTALIYGMRSIDEAANLASLLRSGALPLELKQLEVRTVGPLLGQDSLQRSLRAGLLGCAFLLLFMIAFYRTSGLMASFALVSYLIILLGVLVAMGAVLTLPGIAGIILTIGMAVDANIIIFERFKEEYANGKTFRASIVTGFKKALSTIVDANLTTLIVAIILFRFGTGPVRGFALTLGIGVIVSMISALVITRILMLNLISANIIRRPWMLGVNRQGEAKKLAIMDKRKLWLVLSLSIAVVGVSTLAYQGLNFGIDFTGGTRMHLNLPGGYTVEELRDVLAGVEAVDASGRSVTLDGSFIQPIIGDADEVVIRTVPLSEEERETVLAAIGARWSEFSSSDLLNLENVGPVVGGELLRNATLALLIAAAALIAYISYRFQFKFAIAALVALLFDALVVIFAFSLFRVEMNSPFVAAVLTIVGYSINDTIVVFDRVRENLKYNPSEKLLTETVNSAVNQTLVRSVMTSITTLLVIGSLLVWGGDTIRPFALPLFIGILSGTYSSIFLASSLWLMWRQRLRAAHR